MLTRNKYNRCDNKNIFLPVIPNTSMKVGGN